MSISVAVTVKEPEMHLQMACCFCWTKLYPSDFRVSNHPTEEKMLSGTALSTSAKAEKYLDLVSAAAGGRPDRRVGRRWRRRRPCWVEMGPHRAYGLDRLVGFTTIEKELEKVYRRSLNLSSR
jgi:hypothetical protein